MEGITLRNIILGFLAGAIATVTVHELIGYGLHEAGILSRTPWSVEPAATTGVPQIASDAAWGGLWGIIFALILGDIPKGSMTLKGILLGLIGPALFGAYILVPLMTGRSPFIFEDNVNVVGSALLLAAAFGAATAWLYGFFTAGFRLP